MEKASSILTFGNDGWQGPSEDPQTRVNIVRIADALGLYMADSWPFGHVYVGYDTRGDSSHVAAEVAGVLATYGLMVTYSSTWVPTPAVAWTCAQDEEAVCAVMITTGDRGTNTLGIMVRAQDGGPVGRRALSEIARLIPAEAPSARAPYVTTDIVTAYLHGLARSVDSATIAKAQLSVSINAQDSAAYKHMAELLRSLHVEVKEAPVMEAQADIGLIFDADADRVAFCDHTGAAIPPRSAEPLVLWHLSKRIPHRHKVIKSLACTAQVTRTAHWLNCPLVEVPVGFNRIYQELDDDVLFAAEEFGGMCFPWHLPERDGLLAALYVIEAMAQSSLPLQALVDDLEQQIGYFSYGRRDVHLEPGTTEALRTILPGLNPATIAGKKPVAVSHADGLRLQFESGSWVLMRPSRTQPLVRVYAEAPTKELRNELIQGCCNLLRSDFTAINDPA